MNANQSVDILENNLLPSIQRRVRFLQRILMFNMTMTPNIPPTWPEYVWRIIISLLLVSLHGLYTPISSITSGNTSKYGFADIEEVWKI